MITGQGEESAADEDFNQQNDGIAAGCVRLAQRPVKSSPTFAVSEEKNRWLNLKMAELNVKESDFKETFIRSSGSGGQHVNKTSTCVQIVHIPSGLTVKVSRERSQSINRFLARRELLEMLE